MKKFYMCALFENFWKLYKNNYGYVFTSGPDTWHGLEKKEIKRDRRCLQVNYVTFETDWKVN